ncbi:hypothetical protein [Saccharopolyspora erythraea]|uniref:hypothetical protein n=1 Tax=Saccharopolyspora erythraea TaxID=1836 RepID=UPI0035565B13
MPAGERGLVTLPEDKREPPEKQGSSGDPPWVLITGAAASIVAVLGFFGFSNIEQVTSLFAESASPSSTTEPTRTSTEFAKSETTEPESAEPESTERDSTSEAARPTSTEFDSSTLDDISTDETPFTRDALLPGTFTDSKGVEYSLVASGTHDCTSAAHMSSNMRELLSEFDCSRSVTGNYRPGDDSILVSVQVQAFEDASTAQRLSDAIGRTETVNYGIFCPTNGVGSDACGSSDYPEAEISQYRAADHRYLVLATAFYTNLTSDSRSAEWTGPAAKAASRAAGPENHVGS